MQKIERGKIRKIQTNKQLIWDVNISPLHTKTMYTSYILLKYIKTQRCNKYIGVFIIDAFYVLIHF